MSNFFRDTSLGFKPKHNIFQKLQRIDEGKEQNQERVQPHYPFSDDDSTSLMEGVFFADTANTDTTSNSTNKNINSKNSSNISNINTSTPEKQQHGVGRPITDESEIEITEVRDVENHEEAADKENESASHAERNDCNTGKDFTTSNDVLLEAFTNTQRICSKLKHDLQYEQTNNAKLKKQIVLYQNDIKKLEDKISTHRDFLKSLEDKSLNLSEQKKVDGKIIEDLKSSNSIILGKLNDYKTDISAMKTAFSNFDNWKKDMETELGKKSKEIVYLKKELDECSGQLTEETIRNDTLLSELSSKQTELTKNLDINKNEIQDVFKEKFFEFEKSFEDHLTDELNNKVIEPNNLNKNEITEKMDQHFEKTLSNINSDINQLSISLSELYISNFNESSKSHQATSVEVKECFSNITQAVADLRTTWKDELNCISTSNDKNMNDYNTTVNGGIKSIFESLQSIKEDLKMATTYEMTIKNLEKQIHELTSQKLQCLTSLGIKEAEYEDINKQLTELKSANVRNIEVKEDLIAQINNLTSTMEKLNLEISRLQNENLTLVSNFENKLSAQQSIINSLTSENDLLKQTSTNLEESRKKEEDERLSYQNSVKSLTDQLHKLNVELVQMKATSLEFDKEKRILQEQLDLEKVKCQNEISDHEAFMRDFLVQKEKLRCLEADKKTFAVEKLNLNEKIDILKASKEKLVSEISFLKRNHALKEEEYKKKFEDRKLEKESDELEIIYGNKVAEFDENNDIELSDREISEHVYQNENSKDAKEMLQLYPQHDNKKGKSQRKNNDSISNKVITNSDRNDRVAEVEKSFKKGQEQSKSKLKKLQTKDETSKFFKRDIEIDKRSQQNGKSKQIDKATNIVPSKSNNKTLEKVIKKNTIKYSKRKMNNNILDEFDLSSSMSEDLENTVSSQKRVKTRQTTRIENMAISSMFVPRKKLLLSDDDPSNETFINKGCKKKI